MQRVFTSMTWAVGGRLPLPPSTCPGSAEPRQGPRRGADRARPRGVGAGPRRRRRPVAAVRRRRRPRGPCSLQRLGRPAVVRPGGRSPGPPLAARGRFDVLHLHEPATPSLSLLALWAAECPVVATFHSSNVRSARSRRRRRSCAPRWRSSVRGSRCRSTPAAPWSSHLGGEPVVIPNGLYVDRFARADAREGGAARTPPSPSWVGSTSPARASRCCSRPFGVIAARASRPPAARRGWRRHRRGRAPGACGPGRPGDVPRAGAPTRTRRPRCAPPTSTSHRTPAARASGSCSSRGCRPARPCWRATSRRSGGCSATGLRRPASERGRRRPDAAGWWSS